MLQLLNIIAFICTYLGGGVGGEGTLGAGAWVPRDSSGWSVESSRPPGHVPRQAPSNPPAEADVMGRGTPGTGDNWTLSGLPR